MCFEEFQMRNYLDMVPGAGRDVQETAVRSAMMAAICCILKTCVSSAAHLRIAHFPFYPFVL